MKKYSHLNKIKSQIPNPKSQINFNSQILKTCASKFRSLVICTLVIICNLVLGHWNLNLYAQDKIIAIVNNDIITQKDLNDFINFMRLQLSAEYTGKELEFKIQSMKLDLLNKLIEDRLILQEAKRDNIMASPAMIKERINGIRKNYGSDSAFQNSLAKQGLVQADLEARINEQLLMFGVIDKKIRNKIFVKPGEVTDFYQGNIRQFISPEQREFESVTIEEKSMAEEIAHKLRKGAQFNDVASEYSLAINKLNSAKDGRLKKGIEEILFKMNIGEVSTPVKIEGSYYIFKLNNITPPRQQTLSEVQNDIYVILFNSRMQEELTKWLGGLRERSYIKVMQD